MQVATLTGRGNARSEYLRYRKSVQERKGKLQTDEERRLFGEDEALRRAYFELARGHQVIDLVESIRIGGCFIDSGLPKLAIARADQVRVICHRGRHGNRVTTFGPRTRSGRPGRFSRDLYFDFQDGVLPPLRPDVSSDVIGHAMVPTIPLSLRPADNLSRYHILWEAVWQQRPPVDPMLLRRLSKNLFSVVAVWDLTDLERAVMNARLAG